MAGLWENWSHPEDGRQVRTFCIVTTAANAMIAAIHDRMPVIVPPESYGRWLSPAESDPRDLLAPLPAERMTMWPVAARVNAPANDDAAILAPLGGG